MQISTPQVLWHGGGNENGKTDPVYAVDMHPNCGVLATAGIDANVPPKGSVRLWNVSSVASGEEFIIELNDHQSVINAISFSPCGEMLATGSDRQIVVYKVINAGTWSKLGGTQEIQRTWFNPSLDEIYDIRWCPDSSHIIAGAINCRAEIIKVDSRDTVLLTGHTSYVQGVAWDPLDQCVVTQSADRSCKIHQIKHKPGTVAKLSTKGHCVLKMTTNGESAPKNLYAQDSSVPCFFRRPAFTSDGALLITPTGIYRHTQPTACNSSSSAFVTASSAVMSVAAPTGSAGPLVYCTHVFARDNWSQPVLSLVGLEEPSVAVRCSPVLFKMICYPPPPAAPTVAVANAAGAGPQASDSDGQLLHGKYRHIFAVVTVSSIFIYDTQHPHPLVRVAGLHLAAINDCTWSSDGLMLVVCSSDGYVTFIKFPEGCLGEALADEDVPDVVKRCHPCKYGIAPTVVAPAVASKVPSTSSSTSSSLSSGASVVAGVSEELNVCEPDCGVVRVQLRSKQELMSAGPGAASASASDTGVGESHVVSVSLAAIPGLAVPSVSLVDLTHPQSAHHTSTSAATTTDKKVKKRITPTLITSIVS